MAGIATKGSSEGIDVGLFIGSEVLMRGIEALLQRLGHVTSIHVYEAHNVQDVLAHRKCDILITSLDQWAILGEISDRRVSGMPRVLVLGDNVHESFGPVLPSLPTDGFLSPTDLSKRSLEVALERVAGGEMPMPAKLARQLLSGNRPLVSSSESRSITLTEREHETLILLANGLSNKQIARALGISAHGAKRLVGAVLLKLGSPNRTAAVVTAIKSGMV